VIGSLRALAILAIVAVAAVVIAIVAPRARTEVVDRRIAPGFDVASVHTLRWQHGEVVDAEVVRAGDGWKLAGGPRADAGAVDEVIAALRGGLWQRREPASRAGTTHERITAIGATTVTLAIGEPLAGTEQVWLVAGDDALLVDGWIAHALGKGIEPPLGLRVREPLAGAAEADRLDIETGVAAISLEGHPRMAHGFLVEVARAHAVDTALSGLALAGTLAGPRQPMDHVVSISIGAPVGLRIATAGRQSCGVWVTGLDGCVSDASWLALRAAIDSITRPDAEIIERRPAPFAISSIRLPDGTLELDKRPAIDGHDADAARAVELVAALAEPATVVAKPVDKPTATIEARGNPTIVLELHDGVVVRRGEPFGLRVEPGVWAVLTRPASSYRDTALWLEEPTAITAITVDGVTYNSGTIVGTWTRQPPGTVDPAALDAAARLLASPRAPPATLPAGFAPQHRISIAVAAPSGPAITHVLEIGAACIAKVDGTGVTLPAPLCGLVGLGR
jgi:hypothetical protein